MYNGKTIFALIPARGGSKRLPGKNILEFNGKPLIGWTIEGAKQSKYLDRVIVSTDDLDIADVSLRHGAEIPFMRPSHLATDVATSNDVIMHMLSSFKDEVDIVILLQPTSPLRTTEDIDRCIELLFEREADGIVSVSKCEHSPLWANTLPNDNNLGSFVRSEALMRSQDLNAYYRLNGSIYCFTSDSLRKNLGIKYTEAVYAYIMEPMRSFDIDTIEDFKYAEYAQKYGI